VGLQKDPQRTRRAGIKVAPSTAWEILRARGIDPAPERDRHTWAAFLRGQAHAILACDFLAATTLNGATVYVMSSPSSSTSTAASASSVRRPTPPRPG
jgi:hypothetical protein